MDLLHFYQQDFDDVYGGRLDWGTATAMVGNAIRQGSRSAIYRFQSGDDWGPLEHMIADLIERVDALAYMWSDGKQEPKPYPRPERRTEEE